MLPFLHYRSPASSSLFVWNHTWWCNHCGRLLAAMVRWYTTVDMSSCTFPNIVGWDARDTWNMNGIDEYIEKIIIIIFYDHRHHLFYIYLFIGLYLVWYISYIIINILLCNSIDNLAFNNFAPFSCSSYPYPTTILRKKKTICIFYRLIVCSGLSKCVLRNWVIFTQKYLTLFRITIMFHNIFKRKTWVIYVQIMASSALHKMYIQVDDWPTNPQYFTEYFPVFSPY